MYKSINTYGENYCVYPSVLQSYQHQWIACYNGSNYILYSLEYINYNSVLENCVKHSAIS